MIFSFSQSAHQKACAWKRQQLAKQIDSLPSSYSSPSTPTDQAIHSLSIKEIVQRCNSGELAPPEVLCVYAKRAIQAHRKTNCLSDVMFEESLRTPAIANWVPGSDSDTTKDGDGSREKLLMGVPVSIKDTLNIFGHDTTIGFSQNVNKPAQKSSAMVQLLRDTGALVHAKTTVPTGLLSLETSSDIFGVTTNPYNKDFTPGASTGGGAALVACGGTKIEIGTDVGGSVRYPAHCCGIYSLKASAGRFPNWGNASSLPGMEAIPLVSSPLAQNLNDLEEFSRRVVLAKPWDYDHTCIPLPWRPVDLREDGRKLKWGVIWSDGIIPPTPACRRALANVVAALKQQGHEVVDYHPPNISQGLNIGYQLLFSDGGEQIRNATQPTERLNPSVLAILSLLSLPRLFKKFLSTLSRFHKDPINAELASIMHSQTILTQRQLVEQRDDYRAQWHESWVYHGLDFVLTPVYPLPAVQHGTSEKATLLSAGYTFLFSLLDYTAGVLPVTRVNSTLDYLPQPTASPSPSTTPYPTDKTKSHPQAPQETPQTYQPTNPICEAAYSIYNADKMHGLPIGVQIVGRRLEEEKVLEGMYVMEKALKDMGIGWKYESPLSLGLD
ncbi:amidase signature enzyme [Pluteus cervinus]|uniref:Amidase signature enzyme n=1 Tax=Pluteus cervinus TaxID=181527 RepID=A0ACD3AJ95_9AGAR|nr:amidase signature enzyme [Pluteus cervinus]